MAAVLVVGLTFVCSPAVFLLLCLDLWTARCVFRRYVLAAFGRELNAKYPARLFSSRLRLRLWCPAATLGPFSFTLSWPRLFFFRDNFPYLSFPFSHFALHICVGLFVAPCLPPLCHFPLLYLLSSVIFRLFGRLHLPHFVAYLFLPLSPRPLLSFHPSPSPSSFPVFPPPSPLLSPRAPLIISLPRYWSTRPSI